MMKRARLLALVVQQAVERLQPLVGLVGSMSGSWLGRPSAVMAGTGPGVAIRAPYVCIHRAGLCSTVCLSATSILSLPMIDWTQRPPMGWLGWRPWASVAASLAGLPMGRPDREFICFELAELWKEAPARDERDQLLAVGLRRRARETRSVLRPARRPELPEAVDCG